MASLVDACVFVAAAGGTGTFTVASALTGWRTPAQAGANNGATYRYRAYSADNTQWEVGSGVYSTGATTLTRAVILASSNAGAAVNFTNPPNVVLTAFAADFASEAQLDKVDFLTVTGSVDLDAMKVKSDYLTVTATTNLDTIRVAVAALGTAATKNTGTSAGQVPLLDGSGLLDTSILPAIAITVPNVVASEAAMLALTAQQGDVAIRTDINKSFILSTNSPGTLADWKELLTPTDAVLSVASLTGAISATSLTAALNAVVGDSGSGGTKGLAPAPGAGDAAAGKFLKADGTYAVPGGGGVTDVQQPTSNQTTITTTGLSSCKFIELLFAFSHNNASAATYTIEGRSSIVGTWRQIVQFNSEADATSSFGGRLTLANFNVAQQKVGESSIRRTTSALNAVDNPTTISTNSAFNGAVYPSWSEAWDELRITSSVASSIEGATAAQRGLWAVNGHA